jgi:hypothetical protein
VATWEKKTKVNDACCALYITALVAGVLELETTVLHVPDPTVGYICTPIMVAIPLFPYTIICPNLSKVFKKSPLSVDTSEGYCKIENKIFLRR